MFKACGCVLLGEKNDVNMFAADVVGPVGAKKLDDLQMASALMPSVRFNDETQGMSILGRLLHNSMSSYYTDLLEVHCSV